MGNGKISKPFDGETSQRVSEAAICTILYLYSNCDLMLVFRLCVGHSMSFSSAQEMRAHIELLPSPPAWKEVEVHVEGSTMKDPLTLYYCDGLECFKHIFGCPLYDKYMDYCPRREYTTEEKTERLYNEMMTGDRAWTLQVYFSFKLLMQTLMLHQI